MIEWDQEIKKQVEKNLLECKKKLESKEYRTKIEKWCRKFGFDFNEVLEKAKSDHLFRAFFAKDPKKQNIYESLVAQYLKSWELVSDFKKLSSSGKNALYVDRGNIRKGNEFSHHKPAKSIDFFWTIKTKQGKIIRFYAFHKYIEESGGAQDNQFKEIKNCIEVGRNGSWETYQQVIFVCICDGNYFTEKKIKELKNLIGNWNCMVLSSGELTNYLLSLWEK